MTSVLHSCRYGIIVLQSIRAFEALTRLPPKVKVYNIKHACSCESLFNSIQFPNAKRCNRFYSTSDVKALRHATSRRDKVLIIMSCIPLYSVNLIMFFAVSTGVNRLKT